MSAKHWRDFCELPDAVVDRLTAIFEHFCALGGENLPKTSLRWMTPTPENSLRANLGAFEAHGVVISGRRAPDHTGDVFFVTEITIDEETPPPPPPGRKRNVDVRQRSLPFGPSTDQKRR